MRWLCGESNGGRTGFHTCKGAAHLHRPAVSGFPRICAAIKALFGAENCLLHQRNGRGCMVAIIGAAALRPTRSQGRRQWWALAFPGTTYVEEIIERGYENFVGKLGALGSGYKEFRTSPTKKPSRWVRSTLCRVGRQSRYHRRGYFPPADASQRGLRSWHDTPEPGGFDNP